MIHHILLLLLVLHIFQYSIAQNNEKVFIATEPMPAYPGGEEAMFNFIKENLVYPKIAQEKGIEGQVIAQFRIAPDGDIVNIRIKRSLVATCDSAVICMINTMPKWIPVNKDRVSNELTLPVNFRLPEPNIVNGKKIYKYPEKIPEFVGGIEAMNQFINDNLRYPPECGEMAIQGRVIIRITITNNGKVKNSNVIRGIETYCDKEALRVVDLMPDWIPAKHKGENVDAYYILPIVFRIN